MKKTFLILLSIQFLFACNNQKDEKKNQDSSQSVTQSEKNTDKENITFDINSIPVSTQEIGDFPFITLPKGLKNQNNPLQKNFDVCFFPINGVMTPIEGKLYKTNVVSDGTEDFSQRYYEKSLEDYLTSVGAVKIFEGKISEDEYKRYNEQDPNKGDDGDIGYANELIKVYVLRTKDKGTIYIQSSANSASGKLNILQEEAFKQTISKVTSDDIANDLIKNGKSVLHINFDTDKATLKTDGLETVQEIIKVLKKNPELKIAINGYTDNVGNKEHNQKLSEDRAATVKNEILKSGITIERLTSKGFGQENPLVDNDTEEGRSKNRRVELVKL